MRGASVSLEGIGGECANICTTCVDLKLFWFTGLDVFFSSAALQVKVCGFSDHYEVALWNNVGEGETRHARWLCNKVNVYVKIAWLTSWLWNYCEHHTILKL